MKKGQSKLTIILILVVIVLAVAVFLQFLKPSIQSVTGEVIDEGLRNELCPYAYQIDVIDEEWKNVKINHNCPHITGGIRNGRVELLINIENLNNIALDIPCYVEISRTNFDTEPSTQYDQKRIKDFTISVNPKSSKVIKESFYIPECYGSYIVECANIEELPECVDYFEVGKSDR